MILAALAAASEAVSTTPSEAAPPAAQGVVETARLALAVSLLALGWQIVSWVKSQRPRAKIEVGFATASTGGGFLVTYNEEDGAVPQPAPGSGRGSLMARVLNLGVHAFEVTSVSYEPPKGNEGGAVHIASRASPDTDHPADGIPCSIPGVVNGHSQGLIWVYMEDLVPMFPPGSKIVVKVTLGSGSVLRSKPVSMDELLAADASRPAAATD